MQVSGQWITVLFLTVAGVTVFIYFVTMSPYIQPLTSVAFFFDARGFPLLKMDNTSIPMATVQEQTTQKDIFEQVEARKMLDETLNLKHTLGAKYAVISASTPYVLDPNGYNYVFDLPLTVIAWQRIGFKSIVFISGAKSEWQVSPVLKLVLRYLKDLHAVVFFVEAKVENWIMLSQTSRLFACCLKDLNPGDYLLTSDSDLWPIDADKYQIRPGKSLLSTYANCCGDFNHKSERFLMLPLSNIGATVSTWQYIMFGNAGHCINLTAEAILDYFAKEFGLLVHNPTSKGENDMWYLDQHMASIRIQQWIQTHNNFSLVEFATRETQQDRLGRNSWDTRRLDNLTDTHLLEFLYRIDQWQKVQPVLTMLYGKGSSYFNFCQKYWHDFSTEMTLMLNITL